MIDRYIAELCHFGKNRSRGVRNCGQRGMPLVMFCNKLPTLYCSVAVYVCMRRREYVPCVLEKVIINKF